MVAADLGRTDRWVRKWVARYDPADETWAEERSRAPRTQAHRTEQETEELVLKIRQRLHDNPWAQVGAVAIAWEMEKLKVTPPERSSASLLAPTSPSAAPVSGTATYPRASPYPGGPLVIKPNAVHEIDLVGPRHLQGALPFYALNAVDLGRRRAGIEIIQSKEEWQVAEGLVSLWRRLGVPGRAKFDNGQTFQGRGRHLALPVWTCLALGARVRFIPFAEPWRNPVVEHFNDTFDKQFFRAERFSGLAHLKRRARAFERFHNSHHRYPILKGVTPDEFQRAALHFAARLPDEDFELPTVMPRRGLVEFVRLIRSDRTLKVLGSKFQTPPALVHRYVTATLHVRTQKLVIESQNHPWREELSFPLKF